MEKLDATVAAAGAAILVVAIVGAAIHGGGATATYDLTFPTKTGSAGLQLPLSGSPARANVTVNVTDSNIQSARVKVTIAAAAFPSGASAHVKVTPPRGNATEKDATAPPGGTSIDLDVEIPVAPLPAARAVDAASPGDALARGWASNVTDGTGAWTIDASYAPGPVAPPQFTVRGSFEWTAWTVDARLHADAPK